MQGPPVPCRFPAGRRCGRRRTVVQGRAVVSQAALIHVVVNLQLHLAADVHGVHAEPGAGHAREGHVKLRGGGGEGRTGRDREGGDEGGGWRARLRGALGNSIRHPAARSKQAAAAAKACAGGGGPGGCGSGSLGGTHVDLEYLPPARIHAQFVHGRHAGEEPCGGSEGRVRSRRACWEGRAASGGSGAWQGNDCSAQLHALHAAHNRRTQARARERRLAGSAAHGVPRRRAAP